MIILRNRDTKEEKRMTLVEVLHEINRDRSEEFLDYNETDWRDGLELTDYELVGVEKCICSGCGNEHDNEG